MAAVRAVSSVACPCQSINRTKLAQCGSMPQGGHQAISRPVRLWSLACYCRMLTECRPLEPQVRPQWRCHTAGPQRLDVRPALQPPEAVQHLWPVRVHRHLPDGLRCGRRRLIGFTKLSYHQQTPMLGRDPAPNCADAPCTSHDRRRRGAALQACRHTIATQQQTGLFADGLRW